MVAGIVAGLFLRGKPRAIYWVERSIMWSIYLLLFFLGLAIGSNPLIMAGLAGLGLTALWITLGGMAGSIVLAAILWKYVFSKPR